MSSAVTASGSRLRAMRFAEVVWKAVAGENALGAASVTMPPSKNRGAAVGVPGTELNVVAHHEDGHAPAGAAPGGSRRTLLELRVRPLVGSSINRISGSSSSTFASAARCCSPPDRS